MELLKSTFCSITTWFPTLCRFHCTRSTQSFYFAHNYITHLAGGSIQELCLTDVCLNAAFALQHCLVFLGNLSMLSLSIQHYLIFCIKSHSLMLMSFAIFFLFLLVSPLLIIRRLAGSVCCSSILYSGYFCNAMCKSFASASHILTIFISMSYS